MRKSQQKREPKGLTFPWQRMAPGARGLSILSSQSRSLGLLSRPQSLPPTAGQPRGHPRSRRGSKTPCHAPRLPGPACGWCLSSLASGLTALHGCPAAPSRDRLLVPPPPSPLPPPSWAAPGPAAAAQPSATFAAHTTRSDPAPTTAPSKHPGLRHAPSVRPPSLPGSLPRS